MAFVAMRSSTPALTQSRLPGYLGTLLSSGCGMHPLVSLMQKPERDKDGNYCQQTNRFVFSMED